MSLLKDQVAIITRAGSGIGKATALRLVAEGAAVVLVDRQQEKLAATAEEINRLEVVEIVPGDVCDAQVAKEAVRVCEHQFGKVDIVVNNAAVAYPVEFPETKWDSWQEILDVILQGAFHFSREAAQSMIAKQIPGRIVNVTSIHGTLAESNGSSYGTAKAAVNQFTRCLVVDLAPHQIRANSVAPGFVDTPMGDCDGVHELELDYYRRNYIENRRIPLARASQPEEIAAAILFLASEESSYVNGHVLVVDGGLTCTL